MKVFLGLGSNRNAPYHISQALLALRKCFGAVNISPVYESKSVGFVGNNFLNLVVQIETDLSVGDLLQELRCIENDNGRDRTAPRFSARTLDIDILLYGDAVGDIDGVKLPREEILENAFVLQPLFDLAPDLVHPQENKTIAELWENYDKTRQSLWRVELDLSAAADA
ncbi:2-amino-4-hydroxy-6-hydroxymethyldihydropteridine diphosphokinase [Saccharophagus sp. K07]|jgi:2-amino-4-hydroxy-6-hydroxymethyldihydropteridine diphosphokinase|uniref:2-amino-4-hydroxy-6- hydroxymethyldihydropteridine diphosphokinase n=1 Tax=Saccharophagus sp. K07 TaxID=2283636 RepID=UPI00165293EA|nr:2-amino-4-hydroxy-6-hydroxymethyldihydropteridine diphosphokinase [Saccharophagus sp. K07]MBC6903916.1 2-amino-4-hydroxy-6-hydroxymethyldihydropteridine diphosphokinase [Saccharophagus sp. K07]